MTAAILLASIVTRSLGAFLTVPGWQTNAIPSESICYGTDDSSFYLRPTAESAAAVNSLMDAIYERDIVGRRYGTDVTTGGVPIYSLPQTVWPTCSVKPLGIRAAWDNGGARVIPATFRMLNGQDIINCCDLLTPGGVIDDMGWYNASPPPIPNEATTFPIWNGISTNSWLVAFPTFSALSPDGVYRGRAARPSRKTLATLAGFFRTRSESARFNLDELLTAMSRTPLTNDITQIVEHPDILPRLTNVTLRLDAKKIGAANNLAAAAEVSYAVTNFPPLCNLFYEKRVRDCGKAVEGGSSGAVAELSSNRWAFASDPTLRWNGEMGGVSVAVSNMHTRSSPTFRVEAGHVDTEVWNKIDIERFLSSSNELTMVLSSAWYQFGGRQISVRFDRIEDLGSNAQYRSSFAWNETGTNVWEGVHLFAQITDQKIPLPGYFPRNHNLTKTVRSVYTDSPSHTNVVLSETSAAIPMISLWPLVRQERLYHYSMTQAALDVDLFGPLNIDSYTNGVVRFNGSAANVTSNLVDQQLTSFAIADSSEGAALISRISGKLPRADQWDRLTDEELSALAEDRHPRYSPVYHDLIPWFTITGEIDALGTVTSMFISNNREERVPVTGRGIAIGATEIAYEYFYGINVRPEDTAAQYDCFEALATRTWWRFRNLSPAD